MLFGLDLMSSNAASIAAGTLATLRALQQTAKLMLAAFGTSVTCIQASQLEQQLLVQARQHGKLVACLSAADSVEGLVGAKLINTGLVHWSHTQQSALLLVCHENKLAWV